MAGRKYVGFNVDTDEAKALTGLLTGLSTEVKSNRYLGSVLKYTHALMSEEFDDHMLVVAGSQPSRFHHVFEWGMIGNPIGKLWANKLVGNGNNRVATFEWRASKKTVPVREDFAEVGVKQIHVFVWKAPMMEAGVPLTITPKRGKFLVYFTGPTNPEDRYPGPFDEDENGKPMRVITDEPIRVTNPGGSQVVGAFTREYVSWWAGSGSSQVFEGRVKKVLEEDLGRMPIESVTRRFRRKTVSMQVLGNSDAAHNAGKAAAQKYLRARSANYIAQARARERLIYGV